MWLWQTTPDSDSGEASTRDTALAEDMAKLRSWFRQHGPSGERRTPQQLQDLYYQATVQGVPFREPGPEAWGYGFGWSWDGAPKSPLVLLTYKVVYGRLSLEPSERTVSRPVPIEDLLTEAVVGQLELPKTKLPLLAMVADEPRGSTSFAERIGDKLLGPSKYQICCAETGSLGTLGFRLGRNHYLTAGHVFPNGRDSRCDYFQSQFLWRRRKRLGEVVMHSVALRHGDADWDVAVIETPPWIATPALNQRMTGFRGMRPRQGEERVYANGATSGHVDMAVLIGGLEEVAGHDIKWRNCWLIGPSNILTGGDSGAAVFTYGSDELLGTYVGSSSLRGARSSHAHYVQDAWSLDQQLLKRFNFT
ncbi:MAG: hypothetical protein JNL93_02605 [Pelomonas sp.]|nr:hypothetical protein [Roseateles sp.]